MSLIDISYFVGELSIPNTDKPAIAQQVNWFIGKYEQDFLRKLLGYPLYKAFIAEINVVAPAVPAQRILDILYGKEYIDRLGRLAKWRGIIVTDNPVFNMTGGYVYKPPVTIVAGVTPGLTPGTSTAIFDGNNGKPDWRGWTTIIFRSVPMDEDVDYSWNKSTGTLQLLVNNDKFGPQEKFFVQFELRNDPLIGPDVSPKQSMITNYVYYWFRRNGATQTAGIGEVQTNSENSRLQDPNEKMAHAWNEMSGIVGEFVDFMDVNTSTDSSVYPEWEFTYRYDTIREFQFINPIF